MKQVVWTLLAATFLGGCTSSIALPPQSMRTSMKEAPRQNAVQLTTPPAAVTPADQNVLFWNQSERSARFRDMESWFPGYEVAASETPRDLVRGLPFSDDVQSAIAEFMRETNAAGLMVLKDGELRHVAYGLDLDPDQRWTSFSVAKSFTSSLLGAAVQDGSIDSLDDSVAKYIPEMAGSEYEAVTVRQLATMTSGIRWNEDYTDPDSDVARMGTVVPAPGEDAIVTQLKALPREAPPGEKFVYKTGETNLLGVLVERATGMNLATYAKTKIVDPAGFAHPMFWMIEPSGRNIGGCCLSLTLADYARFGQYALEGGNGAVGEGWMTEAGSEQISFGGNGFGYGYQWWTYPGNAFGAQGIFGQAITIIPDKELVVAVVSNWPQATSMEYRRKWQDLVGKIAAAE